MRVIGLARFALYLVTFGLFFFLALYPHLWAVVLVGVLTRERGKARYHRWMARWVGFWGSFMTGLLPILGLRVRVMDWPSDAALAQLRGRSCIIVGNHQSTLDGLVFPAMVHRAGLTDARWPVKSGLRKALVLGRAWYEGGNVFLDRDRRGGDIRKMEALAALALAEGAHVAFFPEGTRAPVGTVLPPKPGGFLTLVRAMPGAPIVSFTFAFDAPVGGGRDMWQGSAFHGRTLSVSCHAHPPLDPERAVAWLEQEWERKRQILAGAA